MHKKLPCFINRPPPPNYLWPIKLAWMVSGTCVIDPLDENNSICEHLRKLTCRNVQTTIRLPLLHLDYINYPHISNYVYAKIFLKSTSVQFVKLRNQSEPKGCLYMNFKWNHFTKMSFIDVHTKFVLEGQPLVGVNTLT